MSDFELLSIVLMILSIVVTILIAYINQKSNRPRPNGVLPVKRTMKNNKFFSVSLLTGWRYFYAAFNVSS